MVLRRIIWNPFGALIVGVIALGLGIAAWRGLNLPCKDTTTALVEGQTCLGRRRGEVLTFEMWQSQQELAVNYLAGLGAVLIVGGVIALIVRRRRQQRTDTPAEQE